MVFELHEQAPRLIAGLGADVGKSPFGAFELHEHALLLLVGTSPVVAGHAPRLVVGLLSVG